MFVHSFYVAEEWHAKTPMVDTLSSGRWCALTAHCQCCHFVIWFGKTFLSSWDDHMIHQMIHARCHPCDSDTICSLFICPFHSSITSAYQPAWARKSTSNRWDKDDFYDRQSDTSQISCLYHVTGFSVRVNTLLVDYYKANSSYGKLVTYFRFSIE